MPLFRRYGRPGLLGGLRVSAVLGGTPEMIVRSVGLARANGEEAPDDGVQSATSPAINPLSAPPLADQLRSLIDIHAHGDISDDEFVLAKARLLE